jgi:nucleoside-diphosphate-sugar epimerase
MKKILITGANGFVGSFLKKKLCLKYKVYGVDIIKDNFKHKNYKFTNHDVSDSSLLKKFSKINIDQIVHLSAISTDKIFKDKPASSFSSNINSVINLLNLASLKKIENFTFASSEWAYGNQNMMKKLNEKFKIDRSKNLSGYGVSKLIGEDIIINFYNNNIIKNYTILRFGIVFGPRKKPSSAVEGLLKEVKKDKIIFIGGSKKSARKFIYIDDLISGLEKVIKKKRKGIYNLSNDKLYNMEDIVKTANNIFKLDKKIFIKNKSKPVIRNMQNQKFKKTFLWKPKYDLKLSIKDIIKKVDYLN